MKATEPWFFEINGVSTSSSELNISSELYDLNVHSHEEKFDKIIRFVENI